MNERIQELAERAGIEIEFDDYGEVRLSIAHGSALEKYTELLIQECIEQLELVRKYRYDRIQPLETQQTIIDECQYQIKHHFGVEE